MPIFFREKDYMIMDLNGQVVSNRLPVLLTLAIGKMSREGVLAIKGVFKKLRRLRKEIKEGREAEGNSL